MLSLCNVILSWTANASLFGAKKRKVIPVVRKIWKVKTPNIYFGVYDAESNRIFKTTSANAKDSTPQNHQMESSVKYWVGDQIPRQNLFCVPWCFFWMLKSFQGVLWYFFRGFDFSGWCSIFFFLEIFLSIFQNLLLVNTISNVR